MKKSLLLATTAALAFSPLAVQVASADESGVIIGVSGVRDDSNLDELVEGGSSDAAWGWDIYVGYALNRYVTLRGGQRFFGEAEVKGVGGQKLSIDADGLYLATDVMWPVSDSFSVGATLGIQDIHAKFEYARRYAGLVNTVPARDSDDARDFFYGVRARWVLGESSSFLAFYNRYSFGVESSDDLEYDSLGLGLEWRF